MPWSSRQRLPFILHCVVLPAGVALLVFAAPVAPLPWRVLCMMGAALATGLSGAWLLRGLGREKAELCIRDEELFQSQKLAAIGEISAGVAHEINTPLGIILQEAELMTLAMEDMQLSAEALRHELEPGIQEVFTQVGRCRDITHRMLSFSRRNAPVPQHADINQIAMEMARLVEREAANANVTLERRLDEDLPALVTDMPQLRQVLLNLLTNALQALQAQKGGGTIRLSTERKEDWVLLKVWDNGPGVPKEIQSKIFDPFFTTKPPGVGTGLGLSISLRIMQELGGRLVLQSEPGNTTFTIYLPSDHKT